MPRGGQVQVQQVTDSVGSQALWQLGGGEQATHLASRGSADKIVVLSNNFILCV